MPNEAVHRAGAEAEARRRAAIDRLGSLTLANRKLNPDLVRKNPESFDEDVVDVRGPELADLLAQEWPGPKWF